MRIARRRANHALVTFVRIEDNGYFAVIALLYDSGLSRYLCKYMGCEYENR